MNIASRYVASTGLQPSLAVVTSGLYSVTCFNSSGGLLYLLLFDAKTLPANTAVPIVALQIATLDTRSIDFPQALLSQNGGFVAALSTTAATLTVAGSVGFILAQVI